ncbi:hypothetical protein, partial [Actinoplanes sp. NPDC049681]|uniref:hypothetical protein n=1 Tax=Actinoplanes sp. NPDC049681 TaxID=3363905 RepID=UPI0037BDA777
MPALVTVSTVFALPAPCHRRHGLSPARARTVAAIRALPRRGRGHGPRLVAAGTVATVGAWPPGQLPRSAPV